MDPGRRRIDAGDDRSGTDKPRRFLTGRITGAQTGAVLAFVSSGILGQYDPFGAAEGGGCLLLVYPERHRASSANCGSTRRDFRLWVCLHEVTHRVQFTANPWLADYMSNALGVLTAGAPPTTSARWSSRLADFVRGRGRGRLTIPSGNATGILGLMRAVQSEPQRKALDQLLGAWARCWKATPSM